MVCSTISGIELGGADVVQQVERRCALHRDVVHAMIHEVRGHAGVQAQLRGACRQFVADGRPHGAPTRTGSRRAARNPERKEAGRKPPISESTFLLKKVRRRGAFDFFIGLGARRRCRRARAAGRRCNAPSSPRDLARPFHGKTFARGTAFSLLWVAVQNDDVRSV